jgi:hypothetical protein
MVYKFVRGDGTSGSPAPRIFLAGTGLGISAISQSQARNFASEPAPSPPNTRRRENAENLHRAGLTVLERNTPIG